MKLQYKFFVLSILIILLGNTIQSQNQYSIQGKALSDESSIIQKLSYDLNQGVISENEWAINTVYALFDPSKLPTKYNDLSPATHSTSIFTEIFQIWNFLDYDTKGILMEYGFTENGAYAPPDFLQSKIESDHFEFHYSVAPNDTNAVDPTDNNANGIPDYVDEMMLIFEFVYNTEIGTIGFNAPPSDSGNIGNDAKYDIYISKIKSGVFGITYPHTIINDNPGSSEIEKNSAISYIAMRNNYSDFNNLSEYDNLRVTAAHEYNHSIQFGYDAYEKSWLKEATATWVEDEVYDYINENYGYLTTWFNYPQYPVDATNAEFNNRWYGSFIFIKYIAEKHGGWTTIRQIWEKSIDYDSKQQDRSFDAINDVLISKGTNFEEVFTNFTLFNLYKTISPYDYEEGDAYPEIAISKTFFTTLKNTTENSLRHGAYYYKLMPISLADGGEEIEIDLTLNNPEAKINLIVTTREGNVIDKISPVKRNGKFNYSISGSTEKDEIYLVVVNSDSINSDFTLDISYKGRLVKLSDIGNENYGQLSDEYYLETYKADELSNKFNLNLYSLDKGTLKSFTFENSLSAYLARSFGYFFVVTEDTNGFPIYYGYRIGNLNLLPRNFYLSSYPVVEFDKVYFYGAVEVGENDNAGIWSVELLGGAPVNILNLNNSNQYPEIIQNSFNGFVALMTDKNTFAPVELIRNDNSIVSSFYQVPNGARIQTLQYDRDMVVWSETTEFLNDRKIKMYDFSSNVEKTIRANEGLDPYSASLQHRRIVWWENLTGVTKINLWQNDSIKTVWNTFNGLYLTDYKGNGSSFSFPIDDDGFAWMENDFTIHYYQFSDDTHFSVDLSDYFEDKFATYYLVRLSDKKVVIEAQSALKTEKIGKYLLDLEDIVTGVEDEKDDEILFDFNLSQNFPNPFNPSTTINFSIPNRSHVKLKIYDILGREIKSLLDEEMQFGVHTVSFNANDFASGIYFYRIEAGSFIQTKKMVLIK